MVLNMKAADPRREKPEQGYFCVGVPGWALLDLKA